jgi:preprotein translocase subunit SecF
MKGGLRYLFEHQYKKLLIIPIILLVLAIGQISFQIATTGDFINKGFSIKGGAEIKIDTQQDIDVNALVDELSNKFPDSQFTVISSKRPYKIGDTNPDNGEAISLFIREKYSLSEDEVVPRTVSERFGASFFRQAFIGLILAFIFMGIVVFLYFRVPVPSLAVILAALSDMIIAVAVFNLLGFRLEAGGIAAFLMLVGYSVDTDVLLSTRVLKVKEGTILSRVYSAMSTGLMMTITTLVAVIVALVISINFGVTEVITQIMTVLLIGLIIDVINTWLQNAALLRWYMEKKHGQS